MKNHCGYLALLPEGEGLTWFTTDARGHITRPAEAISLEEAPALAARYGQLARCLVLPTARANVLWGQLPGRHDARALQALPWLFEEEISSDLPATGYYPLGARGEQIQVAVIDSAWLKGLLAPFAAARLPLDCVTLDAQLLPPGTVLRWGSRWLIHGPEGQIAETEASWLALWWQRAIGPETVPRCYGPLPEGVTGWPCEPAADPLARLAAGLPSAQSLLPRTRARSQNRRLWQAGALLAVLLATQLALNLWQQYRRLAQQQQRVDLLWQARFPGQAARDVQPIEKRLSRLNPPAFSTLLAQLPPLPEGVTVAEFIFSTRPPQLELRLTGPREGISQAQAQLAGRFALKAAPDGRIFLAVRP